MSWKDKARSAIGGYLEGAWPTDSEEHAQLAIYICDLLDENVILLEALEAVEPWFSSLIQTELEPYDTELYDKVHAILVKAQRAIRDAR